jgi:hypothetical protein
MGFFFPHARGSVRRVEGPWQRVGMLGVVIPEWPGNINAIITQAGITQNGNFQFLHTVNDQIFVYVFGDRISELYVAGVGFGTPCNGGENGAAQLLDLYRQKRLSVAGAPAVVTLGGRGFQSFLTGMNLEIADAELQLVQYSLRFNSFPAIT